MSKALNNACPQQHHNNGCNYANPPGLLRSLQDTGQKLLLGDLMGQQDLIMGSGIGHFWGVGWSGIKGVDSTV